MMRELAWINGTIVELSEATIPLDDRGYFFGDGVYEVCRVYRGKPFQLEPHLRRLQRSAGEIWLEMPCSPADLAEHMKNLLEESSCREGYIYIELTRGVAPRGHSFPKVPPSMVMYVRRVALSPVNLDSPAGVNCITTPDERWLRCDIKSINLLPNVIAAEKATRAGAFEALLYRAGGVVTEASRSNIFALIDGTVRTHPESNLILSGITRSVVLEILRRQEIQVEEVAFTLEEMARASEIWLSSTVAEITPVIAVDGKTVGNGRPGDTALSVIEAYRKNINS